MRLLGLALLVAASALAQTALPIWRPMQDGTVTTDRGAIVGYLRLNPGTLVKPTCTSLTRGAIWVTYSAFGVADLSELCSKAADDTYAWRDLGRSNGILSGAVVPGASVGSDGDFYMQVFSVDACLFGPKAFGVWPSVPLTVAGPDCVPAPPGGPPANAMSWNGSVMTFNGITMTFN